MGIAREFATCGAFFDDEDGARTGIVQTLWELIQTVTPGGFRKSPLAGPAGIPARQFKRGEQQLRFNPTTHAQQLWAAQDTLSANAIYAF
jgi:hypothetical protein